MSAYRIIKNGLGEYQAQEYPDISHGWVHFIDLSECSTLKEAEHLLKAAITRTQTKVVGVYDENGNRMNEYPSEKSS